MSVGSAILQKGYVDIYKNARNYIWPFNVVEKLADFEIAVFKAVPDMDDVANTFQRFKLAVYPIAREDEELQKSLDAFDELIRGEHRSYNKIQQVREIVQNENKS